MWLTARHDVPNLANQANVRFRVAFGSDGSVNGFDGFAFDDFEIFEAPPIDGEMLAVIRPATSACGLSANDTVEVMYSNRGSQAFSMAPLSFSLNGATPVTEVDTQTVAPGDTAIYRFTSTVNLSATGNYTIDAWVALTGDPDQTNDSTLNNGFRHKPSISSFPYIQNFDGPLWTPVNTNSSAPVIVLPDDWENNQDDALTTPEDWALRSAPTTSSNTGPDFDHTTGSTNYIYVEDSGFENDSVMMVTPCFDIGALMNPELSFWVHSNNDNDPNNENELHLDIFANGTWTQDIIAPIKHRNPNWNQVQVSLTPYIAAGNISFRFRVNNNNGWFAHDIAIDDFMVTEILPNDLGASGSFSPNTGCDLGNAESVVAEISNYGVLPQDTFDVAYSLNGATPVVETVMLANNALPPGGTVTYTFTTTVDLSTPGTYTLDIFTTNLAGDTNLGNDSTSRTATHKPPITNFPYMETFDDSASFPPDNINFGPGLPVYTLGAGWDNSQEDDRQDWVPRENPTGSFGTGPNGDHTGGGTYLFVEDDFDNDSVIMVSPCFDISALGAPELRFWIHSNGGGGGSNLLHVDAIYQGNVILDIQPPRTDLGPNWVQDSIDLTPFPGIVAFRFRVNCNNGTFTHDIAIDDVELIDVLPDDLGATQILSPSGGLCGDSVQAIEVEIFNFGSEAQNNFPVTASVNGGTPITVNYPDTLLPGRADTVLVGSVNTYAGGFFNIVAYTDLSGDQDLRNDTTFVDSVEIIAIPAPPTPLSDTVILCIPDSTILGVLNDTNFTYTWYDTAVGGTAIAEDTNLYQTPFLTQNITYYVDATPGSGGPALRLTEFDLSGPDMIEIQNLSNTPIDATGWIVAVSDAYNDINIVNTTVWNLGVMAPGQVDFRTDGATNPWGSNLFWNPGAYPTFTGWGMIIDDQGTVVDAVFWNWLSTDIAGFNANIGGFTITGADIPWSGDGVDASITTGPLARFGNSDNDDNSDWSDNTPLTTGTQNPNLTLPFSGGGGACASDRVPITVLVAPPVPVDLGPDGAACAGVQVDATTAGAVSYLWSTGDVTPVITIQATGAYSVIVTNADGCTGTDTINLLIQPSPTVTLGNDTTVCGSVLLDAMNPGSSYAWNNGDQTQTSLITASGTYSVLVTNVQGCTDTDTVDVTVLPAPSVNLGPDVSVCGMTTLDAGPGAVSYLWSNGDTTQTTTVDMSGLYDVTVTGSNGCTGTDDIVVNILPNPVVALGADTVFCDLGILDAGNAGSTYAWSTGDNTQTINVTASGTYDVTVTDANLCTGADTITVTVEPSPTADFSAIWTSAVDVSFTNASTPPPGPGVTYLWDFGDGNTSMMENPTHTYAVAGNYQVTLTVTTMNCGDDMTDKLIRTDLEDDLFGRSIRLYPNPSTGLFKVMIEGLNAEEMRLEVTDMAGKRVYLHSEGRFNGNYEHEVDISAQAEGIYLIRISDGERTAFKKVVLER